MEKLDFINSRLYSLELFNNFNIKVSILMYQGNQDKQAAKHTTGIHFPQCSSVSRQLSLRLKREMCNAVQLCDICW